MFKFCPMCASEKISFADGKVFHCPDCGFVYYHNTAAATGCVISVPEIGGGIFPAERIMFLVRGKEPAQGKLDLPGGFVDPGEGILEGLYRELQEEIGWGPPLTKGQLTNGQFSDGASLTEIFTLFASFSNVYPYKNIKYNTCDLYFHLHAPNLQEHDLRLEQGEVNAVRFLKPEDIDYDEIAFDSTRRAIRVYLAKRASLRSGATT